MVKITELMYIMTVPQKWSVAEVKKGKRKGTGGCHSAVLEHPALTRYCFLPFSEYPFLPAGERMTKQENIKE